MANLNIIEEEFSSKTDSYLASKIRKPISRDRNRASDIGFPCDTFHALCRLKGELRQKITVEKKKIFRIGEEWEDPNFTLMRRAGIPVKQAAQDFYWKEFNLSGRLDGWVKIIHPETDEEIEIPLEHKTISPNGFESVKRYKEMGISLTKAKQIWVRKYPAQLMTYMLFKGIDYGMWYFFEKVTGQELWWLLPLDYDYGEEILQRSKRCNENAKKNFIPSPETKEICNGCDFAMTYCFPDKDYGPGFVILSDKEKEEMLNRREELKDYTKEYNSLDKKLKAHFKGQNVICGDFKIESKEIEKKGYTVEPGSYVKVEIKRI